ncbi:hypothetical protein [Terribacillus saccharophilus]|uniref:hypothetical protein n=1 Tax=Terribacillus saccharophilus TaxID=361277 RepID=UPI000C9A28DA|nr:hypothetical protein [Terribacillus goriensis]
MIVKKRSSRKKIFVFAVLITMVIILAPILISQIVKIPLGHFTIGSVESWIGFLGNYAGSIIGGLTALAIARYQFMQDSLASRKAKREENRRARSIIENFILPEIEYNLNEYDKHVTFKELMAKRQADEDNLSSTLMNFDKFKFDDYHDIRLIMVNHMTVDIQKIFSFYKSLYLLSTKENLIKLSYNQINEICTSIEDIREFIK